jgi:hypothetical protein
VLDSLLNSSSGELRSQMMLVAGVGILIWVLLRRSHRARMRRVVQERELAEQQRQLGARRDSGAPLADAPAEVLRWQAAMFDLQRDLKAELETKISVLQSLVRIADNRIATLHQLSAAHAGPPSKEAEKSAFPRNETLAHVPPPGDFAAEVPPNFGPRT